MTKAFVVRREEMAYKNQNESLDQCSLTHYGVLGMKWGVRKDRETKGPKKAKAPQSLYGRNQERSKTIQTSVGDAKVDFYDPSVRRGNNILIDYIRQEQPDRYASEGVAKERFNALKKVNIKYSEDQLKYLTNHDGPNDDRLVNCFHCSMAYELRKRGYNVQAKEIRGGYNFEVQHAFNIKDAFTIKIDPKDGVDDYERAATCYRMIADQCEEYGEGARGQIGIQYYDYDGGHSMNWEIKDGKFRIIDSQGMDRDSYETFMHAKTDVVVQRLDNAEVLPGVTDFVEPYERTEEEEELAKKKRMIVEENRKRIIAAQARKAMDETDSNDTSIKGKVKRLAKTIEKATKELIDKGKDFVIKILNIEDNNLRPSEITKNAPKRYGKNEERANRTDRDYKKKMRLDRWM